MMSRWIAGAVVVGVAVTSLACSSPSAPGPATGPAPATTTTPAATPTPTPTSTPPPTGSEGGGSAVLADGRHPVLPTKVDASKRRVTFDLIVFLTGDAAKKEWAKEHPGEDGPPNDYMVINNNPKLRTLPVAANALIRVSNPANPGDPNAMLAVSWATWSHGLFRGIYWITVRSGRITRIEEQWVP